MDRGFDMARIFCYGSLRRGFGNHDLLATSTYVGDAISEGRWSMLNLGGFPGIAEHGNTAIVGELYDVDADTLKRLDWLEDHPNFYRRTPISVRRISVPSAECSEAAWETADAYVLPVKWADSYVIVKSGDWARRNLPDGGYC